MIFGGMREVDGDGGGMSGQRYERQGSNRVETQRGPKKVLKGASFQLTCLTFQEFKCPFNNECEVTTVTRRFCQKCRLKKCFDVGEDQGMLVDVWSFFFVHTVHPLLPLGMKKEWILSEEEKQQKRQKIEENRAKKRTESGDRKQATSASSSLDQITTPSSPPSASTSASVAVVLERPQARVLPSARSADGSPSQKVQKCSKI